jgi:pimeloyl-ACP methyl ester carboxylesterase
MLDAFLATSDPVRTATIERHVLHSLADFDAWDRFDEIHTPVSVVYGYQDFQPITQAATLQTWMPHLTVHYLNECGHLPWIEQPQRFFDVLRSLLA